MKSCSECHKVKPLSEFSRSRWRDNKPDSYCKSCKIIITAKGGTAIKGVSLINGKEYQREYKKKIRKIVLEHYGNKCACPFCSETNSLFLTIDHKNNDGAEQRRKTKGLQHGGINLYLWIIKNNFPNYLQVLCYNCNCGSNRNNGICPHFSVTQIFNEPSPIPIGGQD